MDHVNQDNIVFGRIPVLELLRSDQTVDKILISDSDNGGSIFKIIAIAKEKGVPIKNVSKAKLDLMSSGLNHQNIIAITAAYKYSDIDDIFNLARSKNEDPLIIILDEIEDPHNMGAIIRTAEVAGAHGVIIPKRRNVGLTPVVMKVSAGAASKIPIVRVSNLTNMINELKEKGVWIYCLEADGDNWSKFDYRGPMAVIIGSEGKGVGQLIRKNSDFIISLPICGTITSLNASVAAGAFIYEVVRQRMIEE